MTPIHLVGIIDRMDRSDKRLLLVQKAYYLVVQIISLLFSPCILPRLAYDRYNLCLYFFRNCKITNKVFESFVQFHWKII